MTFMYTVHLGLPGICIDTFSKIIWPCDGQAHARSGMVMVSCIKAVSWKVQMKIRIHKYDIYWDRSHGYEYTTRNEIYTTIPATVPWKNASNRSHVFV